jgi:hypothetical protein
MPRGNEGLGLPLGHKITAAAGFQRPAVLGYELNMAFRPIAWKLLLYEPQILALFLQQT